MTNGEWREFIADGGYSTPTLWLSEGWDWVQRERIAAPLYWREDGTEFTLGGRRDDRLGRARRARQFLRSGRVRPLGRRAAADRSRMGRLRRLGGSRTSATSSTRLEPSSRAPAAACSATCGNGRQSAFASYPGFAPAEGAVGEYNGKFMCGQFVLKGASCATPRGHSRASYRNFFPPSARWQFTGLRLARDA